MRKKLLLCMLAVLFITGILQVNVSAVAKEKGNKAAKVILTEEDKDEVSLDDNEDVSTDADVPWENEDAEQFQEDAELDEMGLDDAGDLEEEAAEQGSADADALESESMEIGSEVGMTALGDEMLSQEYEQRIKDAIAKDQAYAKLEEETEAEAEEEASKERAASYSKADLKYLAAIIYCEAGSQTLKSKVAVANVVINRKNDNNDWAHVSTIKEVIFDKKWGVQFTPAYGSSNTVKQAIEIYENIDKYEEEGSWKAEAMRSSIKAAKLALNGKNVVPEDYVYFNGYVSGTKSKCKANGWSYAVIDSHIYFKAAA